MNKTLIVKWVVNESERAQVEKVLPELAERSRSEQGNLFYTVYQSETDLNTFFVYESYADAAAVEAHRHSDHYQRIVVNEINPRLAAREVSAVRHLL